MWARGQKREKEVNKRQIDRNSANPESNNWEKRWRLTSRMSATIAQFMERNISPKNIKIWCKQETHSQEFIQNKLTSNETEHGLQFTVTMTDFRQQRALKLRLMQIRSFFLFFGGGRVMRVFWSVSAFKANADRLVSIFCTHVNMPNNPRPLWNETNWDHLGRRYQFCILQYGSVNLRVLNTLFLFSCYLVQLVMLTFWCDKYALHESFHSFSPSVSLSACLNHHRSQNIQGSVQLETNNCISTSMMLQSM